MEIKEIKVGENGEGLEVELKVNGQEFKIANLQTPRELDNAHNILIAIICAEFFELTRMYAKKKGVEVYQVFESKKHLENAFQNYIADFMNDFVKSAVIHANKNWELFENQKEDAKNPKCDA